MSDEKKAKPKRKQIERPYTVLHVESGTMRLIEAPNGPRIAAHLAKETWVIKAATGLEVAHAVRNGIEIERLPGKASGKEARPAEPPSPAPEPDDEPLITDVLPMRPQAPAPSRGDAEPVCENELADSAGMIAAMEEQSSTTAEADADPR